MGLRSSPNPNPSPSPNPNPNPNPDPNPDPNQAAALLRAGAEVEAAVGSRWSLTLTRVTVSHPYP